MGVAESGITRDGPIRVTFAMTHPVQYYSPWFRFITDTRDDIELTVIYATVPTAEQQGVGFGVSFEWDTSPLDGYRSQTVRSAQRGDYLHSDRFFGINVGGLGRAVRESRPDAVVIPGWYSITLVKALASNKLYGLPCIYRGDTPLQGLPARSASIVRDARTRVMLTLFDAFLTVGTRNREYLRHYGVSNERIHFSPNCVDNQFFERSAAPARTGAGREVARARLGIPRDDFAVLFVGKLDENKRAWEVIAATSSLGAKSTAVIVGSGPARDRCRDEAARLGAHAVFPGFVNQSGLGEIYGACDVSVLPSSAETWGLVVNESLAAGTPCIVSDGVGCAPDLIKPGKTGEVFPVGDVPALSAALSRIRSAASGGHDFATDCQEVVSGYSFGVATEGLVAAAQSLIRRT